MTSSFSVPLKRRGAVIVNEEMICASQRFKPKYVGYSPSKIRRQLSTTIDIDAVVGDRRHRNRLAGSANETLGGPPRPQ